LLLREFADQSVAGWDTARRDEFHQMLAYCQEQHRLGNPIDAVYCWHTNRLSRADSIETSHYLHELRTAGAGRIRTRDRWYDLARKEDRALFNLEQDFTNHEYALNLAADSLRGDSLRGRLRVARAEGRRCGGPVPYGYRAE
jgi:DNA invertase Pin-like site-specific DNA recombinase